MESQYVYLKLRATSEQRPLVNNGHKLGVPKVGRCTRVYSNFTVSNKQISQFSYGSLKHQTTEGALDFLTTNLSWPIETFD